MRRSLVVLFMLLTSLVAVAGAGRPASACSCASVDPIDALGFGDVVFAGTVVDTQPGDDGNDLWTFDVVAVVQGAVGPQISVVGDTFCGSDLTGFTSPIVVYASRRQGVMRVDGCLPNPTLETFSRLVDEAAAQAQATPGDGPPGALVVGRDKLANLTVVDQSGVVMARALLDHDPIAAAHCPGTSLVATWSYGPGLDSGIAARLNVVSIVDLATMEVTDRRDINSEWVGITGDRMACLDGGDRVIVTRGFGPNDGAVTVSTANATGVGVSRDFSVLSRAIPHRSGTVVLLPSTAGGQIRTVSSDDLERIERTAVDLDNSEATVGAAFNADGTALAVLVTTSGRDTEYDTGASAVRVFDVSTDGVVLSTSTLVQLPGSSAGRAQWIEWFDDNTWAVERETDSSKVVDVVGTDGDLLASNRDGWGWGLTPIDAGLLRSRNGGISVLAVDGTAVDVTVPNVERVDRQLFFTTFVDPPQIEFPALDTGDLPTISPPDDTIVDEVPAFEVTTQSSDLPLVVVIGSLLLAGLGLAAVGTEFRNWRSRRKPTG